MIQIDEPPNKPFCASCGNPLLWVWLPNKNAWISFVPCSCGTRYALQPHGCRHAQDLAVWRNLPRGEPPNDEYRKARDQIASTSRSSNAEDPDAVRP